MEVLCKGTNAELETGVDSGNRPDPSARSFTHISAFPYARDKVSVGIYIVVTLKLSMEAIQ